MLSIKRSPTPVVTGVKESLTKMAQSGYVTTVSVDNAGMANEAHSIADAYKADRFVAFRISNNRGDFNFDVPGRNYSQPVNVAANEYIEKLLQYLPPEHDERTWIIVWNEIDKNRLEYSSEVAYLIATDDRVGHLKFLFFGLNAGEPEPNQLDKPKFKALMELLQENPDTLGLAVHEYTFDWVKPMSTFTPYLIGRLGEIVKRYSGVTIAVTEFGWGRDGNSVPTVHQMKLDLAWAIPYYKQWPEVRCLALWYDSSQPEWNNIGAALQPIVEYLGGISAFNSPYPHYSDTGEPPMPETPEIDLPYTPQVVRFLLYPQQLNSQEALYIANRLRNGYEANTIYPTLSTTIGASGWSHEDAFNLLALSLQMGNEESRIVVAFGDKIGTGLDKDWVIANHPDLVDYVWFDPQGTGVIPPVEWHKKAVYSPLQEMIVTQVFKARPDYYGQFGFCGHEGVDYSAPLNTPFHAVASGTVVWASDNKWTGVGKSSYGQHVVVKHDGWYSLYAHGKAPLPVSVGDVVKAGDIVALSGNTGNSTGPHLHFSVLLPSPTEGSCFPSSRFGFYTNPTYVNSLPRPPRENRPLSNPNFGLHFNSSPYIYKEEIDEAQRAKVTLLKVLSSHDPNSQGGNQGGLYNLAAKFPNVPTIIRAFVSMKGITQTPRQFLDATLSDVERTIRALGSRPIFIELHNEPNLYDEGLGRSWQDGKQFASWLLPIIAEYKAKFGLPLIYPASSPGASIPNVRLDHRVFENDARAAITACDYLGIHVYWSAGYPIVGNVNSGITLVDDYQARFPNTKMFITECSRNDIGQVPPTIIGNEYITFHNLTKQRRNIEGIAYWLTRGEGFEAESWLNQDLTSKGIGDIVGGR
jgi:murein DD-endopeptidase MepM/ murein hydrolase activator NlpD